MTVPQDTVLCAGLGLLPALLAAGRPAVDRVGPAWLGYALGWLPLSAVFLLGWPSWSWWYPPGALGDLLAQRGPSLALGLAVETAGFALALKWSRERPGPIVRKAVLAIVIIYLALLVLPASRWLQVGTAVEFAQGQTEPLWTVGPLVMTLVFGGAWLVLVQGLVLRRLRAPLIALSLLLVACGGEPVAPSEVQTSAPIVRLAVAPDAKDLVDALLRASRGGMEDGSKGLPELHVLEEGAAYVALIRGDVHGAVVLRGPGPAERKAAAGDGLLSRDPLLQRALARDTIVLAVHVDHAVDVLDFDGAVSLLTGDQATWPDLPGSRAVTVVSPPRHDSARALVVADLLGGRALAGDAVVLTDTRSVTTRVSETPGAIGVTSLAALGGARPISLRTPDGQILEPRTASQNGEWPLARPVLMVTQGPPDPQIDALVAFAGTVQGREAVISKGLAPAPRGR